MTKKKVKKQSMRKQIARLRDMMEDRDLFLSESYRRELWTLVKALGQKQMVKLDVIYEEDEKTPAAFTDGAFVCLNAANKITRQFDSREERIRSHEGLIAHECGHIRYSDFQRRAVYLGGFEKGIMYPAPPQVKTVAEKHAWEEMKGYLTNHDMVAVHVMEHTAAYLSNVLEDVYIESFMCREYPGSVRISIQKNAAAVLSQIPSWKERKAESAGELAAMLDLIFRYARAGKTADESGYLKKHTTCLNACRRIIDEAVTSQDPDIRFYASNQLMLKLWNYVKKEIETAKQALKGKAERLPEEERKKLIREYLKDRSVWVELSDGKGQEKPDGEEIEIDGWDGCSLPNDKMSEGRDAKEPKGNLVSLWSDLNAMSGEIGGSTGSSEQRRSTGDDGWDISGKLSEILNEAAREQYIRQEEKNLVNALKKELRNLNLDEIHKGVRMEVHRNVDISEKQREDYERIAPKIKKASGKLQKSAEEILIRKEGGITSGLYMGKRLSRGNLYRQDGKIFEKKLLPEEGFSIAFAILVDESGSMEANNRIGYAMEAGLVLHDFCKTLSIPVMVYGHSTQYPRERNYQEVVDIFAYADFDSVDGKDHFRMMDMQDRGGNRDGAALRFVGEHLLKRDEEVKILMIISDGNPSAHYYRGELARHDLQKIKRDFTKQGVKLFAAAIGDDREQIEEIYKDGFLNISDLNTMPVKLANLLIKYIR